MAGTAEAPSKPPWQWTVEQRIAERLDRAKMRAREVAFRAKHGPPRVLIEGKPAPAAFVIDGDEHPELFMPFELMNRLLRALRADARGAEMRRSFGPAITAFGWSDDEFWKAFGVIGGRWGALAAKSEQLYEDAHRATPAKRRELEAAAASLDVPMCAARSEALSEARLRFGAEEFDRFLYTVAAAGVTLSAPAPSADEAARLRYVDGGCR